MMTRLTIIFLLLTNITFGQRDSITDRPFIIQNDTIPTQTDEQKEKNRRQNAKRQIRDNTSRIGIIGTFDYAYNFQDKVLSPGLGRKWTIGISFANKNRQFIGFIAAGIKGAKINLYSPSFRQSFLQDVKQNYTPINGLSEDSLIGANMGASNNQVLWGTYSQFLQAGLILNNKFKPSISFYYGNEEFLLHNSTFAQYEDPQHHDINYVGMQTNFYELKIGCTLPFKSYSDQPFCLNLNIGYKWVDYGTLSFNKTPLSAYTTGGLDKKYSAGGKLTISLSFVIWSNWGRKDS